MVRGGCNEPEAGLPEQLPLLADRCQDLEMHRTRGEGPTLMSLIDFYHLAPRMHGAVAMLSLLLFSALDQRAMKLASHPCNQQIHRGAALLIGPPPGPRGLSMARSNTLSLQSTPSRIAARFLRGACDGYRAFAKKCGTT